MSERDKVVDFSKDGKISVQNPLIRIDYAGASGDRGVRGGKDSRGSKGGHGRGGGGGAGGGGGGGGGGKKNRGEVRGDRLGDGGDEGIEPGREG